MNRSTVLVLAALLAAALVLPGAAVTADGLAYRGTVYSGVTLGGRDAAGLDQDDLHALCEELEANLLDGDLSLTVDGETALETTFREAGVVLDVPATVAAALRPGHEGSWRERLSSRVGARLGGHAVDPVFAVDEERLLHLADELALTAEELPRDAELVLTPDGPRASAAEPGRVLDRETLAAGLLAAARAGEHSLATPLTPAEPRVSTEAALEAVEAAKTAFAAPLILGYRDYQVELTPQELAGMAAVVQGGAGARPLSFDTEAGRAVLEAALAPVRQPAEDARIQRHPDGGFEVLPSRDGVEVDWEALFRELDRVAVTPGRRYVPVPTTAAEAKLSTLDATRLGIRQEVASFTTYFSPANEARGNNIRQVASLLDGTLIEPGETFSFNETVGPRTKAAGFDEAPVISGGVLTPGVGGGICQVSTTLFNAVFLAGLPVVERKPHSFFIDHYPVGRDATVSYGTVDFKFTNDSDRLLYLSVKADARSVTVALGAQSWDRRVEYESDGPSRLVEPRTSVTNPRRLRDPALPKGEVAPVEAGVAGRTVSVGRTVYGPDGAVLFRDAFESVYQPKDYIQRVGA